MTDDNHRQPENVKRLLADLSGLTAEERRLFYAGALNPPDPTAEPPDPWQAFSLVDAYKTRPPITYLAGRIFERPSLNILYGAPGTLKSFLLADLLICVAAGEPWLPAAPWQKGGEALHTNQAPTMWCDFDNGRRRTLDRFMALGRGRNLPEDLPITIYSMPVPWLQSTDLGAIGSLAQRAKLRGAGLICIDNLGAVLGDAEENSGDMAKVMSHFRQLAEDTGAAVVLIHHQRKGNGLAGRAGDSLRGHSSIEAALDLGLQVEREPYAETCTITATKTRGGDVLPFRVQFTYEHDQAGEMTTAKFFGLGIEDNASMAAIEREIKTALTDQQLNQSELIKAVKEALPTVGLNRIHDRIEWLASNGKLNTTQGQRNQKIYSV
jgi:hypothetical protein